MFSGLFRIVTGPARLTKDYFAPQMRLWTADSQRRVQGGFYGKIRICTDVDERRRVWPVYPDVLQHRRGAVYGTDRWGDLVHAVLQRGRQHAVECVSGGVGLRDCIEFWGL